MLPDSLEGGNDPFARESSTVPDARVPPGSAVAPASSPVPGGICSCPSQLGAELGMAARCPPEPVICQARDLACMVECGRGLTPQCPPWAASLRWGGTAVPHSCLPFVALLSQLCDQQRTESLRGTPTCAPRSQGFSTSVSPGRWWRQRADVESSKMQGLTRCCFLGATFTRQQEWNGNWGVLLLNV